MSTPAQVPPEPNLVGKPWNEITQKRIVDTFRAIRTLWATQLPARHAKTHMVGGGDALPIDKLTAKGDLLTKTALGYARRGVGSDDQVLTADSTTAEGIKWAASAGGTSDAAMLFAFYMGN